METKIGKNKKTAKIKWTRMDEFLNRITIFIFCAQMVIMIGLGVAGLLFRYWNYNVLLKQCCLFTRGRHFIWDLTETTCTSSGKHI